MRDPSVRPDGFIGERSAARALGISRPTIAGMLLELDVMETRSFNGEFMVRRHDVRRTAWSPEAGMTPVRIARVYFIQGVGGGPIKIGTADVVQNRMRQLQSCHWEELKLLAWFPGFSNAERYLHRRFKAHRVRGEWFAVNPELEKLIADIRALGFDQVEDR